MKSKTPKITLRSIYELMVKKFAAIDHRFEAIDHRFETMDHRFEAIDHRFETMDHRFEAIDQQFVKVNRSIVGIYGELDGIKQQITQLDNKVDIHHNETQQSFSGVYDGLSQLAETLDHDHRPRLERLEKQAGIIPTN